MEHLRKLQVIVASHLLQTSNSQSALLESQSKKFDIAVDLRVEMAKKMSECVINLNFSQR